MVDVSQCRPRKSITYSNLPRLECLLERSPKSHDALAVAAIDPAPDRSDMRLDPMYFLHVRTLCPVCPGYRTLLKYALAFEPAFTLLVSKLASDPTVSINSRREGEDVLIAIQPDCRDLRVNSLP